MSSLIRANCFHIYLNCLCLLLLNKHKEPISHSQSCGNLMKIIHFWFLRIKRSTLFCKALLINSTNLFMKAYFKWGAYTGSRSPPCPGSPDPHQGLWRKNPILSKSGQGASTQRGPGLHRAHPWAQRHSSEEPQAAHFFSTTSQDENVSWDRKAKINISASFVKMSVHTRNQTQEKRGGTGGEMEQTLLPWQLQSITGYRWDSGWAICIYLPKSKIMFPWF